LHFNFEKESLAY